MDSIPSQYSPIRCIRYRIPAAAAAANTKPSACNHLVNPDTYMAAAGPEEVFDLARWLASDHSSRCPLSNNLSLSEKMYWLTLPTLKRDLSRHVCSGILILKPMENCQRGTVKKASLCGIRGHWTSRWRSEMEGMAPLNSNIFYERPHKTRLSLNSQSRILGFNPTDGST